MSVQILTSLIYEIVSHTWSFASVAAKYYIVTALIYLYSKNGLNSERFSKKIREDSRIVLTLFVTAGVMLFILDFKREPVLTVFSQLIALGYLAYLFWEY